MPFLGAAAGIGAVGSIVGGGKQADATKQAAQTQADAAKYATNLQNQQYQTTRADLSPWVQGGLSAQSSLQGMLPQLLTGFDPTAYGLKSTFSYSPSDFQSDPAFQSSLALANKATEASAAARGSVLGGGALKALQSNAITLGNQYYQQDEQLAAQQYQQNYGNAFNTFNNNQNNAFQRLLTLSGSGQNAAAGLGSLGAQNASNVANTVLQGANAQSAGIIGSANAGASAWGGASANISALLSNPRFQSYVNPSNSGSSYGLGSNDEGD